MVRKRQIQMHKSTTTGTSDPHPRCVRGVEDFREQARLSCPCKKAVAAAQVSPGNLASVDASFRPVVGGSAISVFHDLFAIFVETIQLFVV